MSELTSTLLTAFVLGAGVLFVVTYFMVWIGWASIESHFGRGAIASVMFSALLLWLVGQLDPQSLPAAFEISVIVTVIVGVYGLSRDAVAWFRGEYTPPKGPFET